MRLCEGLGINSKTSSITTTGALSILSMDDSEVAMEMSVSVVSFKYDILPYN